MSSNRFFRPIFKHSDIELIADVEKELEDLNDAITSIFPDRGASSFGSIKKSFHIMAEKRYGNKCSDSLDLLVSDMDLIIPKINSATDCASLLRKKILKNVDVLRFLDLTDEILLIVYDTFIAHYESLSITVPVKWIGSRSPISSGDCKISNL